MSRTIRRKNYEKTRRTCRGASYAGWYTQADERLPKTNGHNHEWSYREPTKAEYYKEYWRLHGDNHSNAYGPGKSYRKPCEVNLRSHNRREMQRLKHRFDYEPMFVDQLPNYLWWEWC